MPVEVRRVEPQDWPQLKALRLEALADTPLGYLETLETAQAHDDGEWQYRARRGAVGGDSCQLLALDGGALVGTAVSFLRGEQTAVVAAVYVSPASRGSGLLGRLVDELAQWAREQGATVQQLQVHEDNPRARAAYAKLGFTETGERELHPLPPGGDELTMVRPL